ncbi:class I SAM-dependent methyltransferase [Umezawaea tangerina]|uniref:Methyltransferase family protein n=1 Tax=Umezawaea tangerina TaxID=84725 RepID=A0A2T0T537_9PSEU|nr:class I SAM-dependent methyltransferase [Umezawaea tangerina]PRY40786.1 methyltransferase family protein [Umezawaea tangerina]
MTDSTERFAGFAELYDRARPKPPADIVELVRQWVDVEDPDVVDLGAGTGGATLLWDRAIAVEPSADMRELAHQRLDPARFQVVDGTAEATGLPDDCADVVTASQALHWFDPATAFPEIARILRPGGVFVAFDCDWPPAVDREVDAAWAEFEAHLRGMEQEHDFQPPRAKGEHVDRLRASGLFAHVTEVCLHGKESGDARRLYELALSQSGSMGLRKAGYSDEQIGLAALHEVANRRLPVVKTWWWTYRVRLAVTSSR